MTLAERLASFNKFHFEVRPYRSQRVYMSFGLKGSNEAIKAVLAKCLQVRITNRVTMSEEDAVCRHIVRCWNPPVGTHDAPEMKVRIIGSLRRDGVVQKVDVVERDKARMRQEPFFRAFAESALRAFYKCRPLPLPPHKYESWKAFDIEFSLKDMAR